MVRLYMLLFLVQIVLAAVALISCLSAEEDELRALPRIVWVFVILLFPLLGSIAYFAAGRPRGGQARPGTWRVGGGLPERTRPRPVAPDDDPEFLRSLDADQARKDREMFERWEADLRRREDDVRRREAERRRPEENET